MLEWIELSTQATVVASETGVSLHLPQAFGADPFRTPMRGAGNPTTTRHLLEGCIALAGRVHHVERARRRAGREPRPAHHGSACSEWAYRLAGYFHTTRATRRILPRIAQRFESAGRPVLVDWARQKINEEAGHDELALKDLSALGYDAKRVVSALCPPRAAAWVRLFERLAGAANPAGCVGYAHALERLALLRGAAEIAAIEARLPPGLNATRCLRVHSALGSDKAHVDVNIAAAAASTADERRAIATACHQTALIYFDPAYVTLGSRARARAPAPAIAEQLNALRTRPARSPASYPNQSETIGAFNG